MSDTVKVWLLGAGLLAGQGTAPVSRKKRSQAGRRRVTVDVGDKLARSIDGACVKVGLTPSAVIRLAISEYLQPAGPGNLSQTIVVLEDRARKLVTAFEGCRDQLPDGAEKDNFQASLDDFLVAIRPLLFCWP